MTFDVGALHDALDAQRAARGMTWTQLAHDIGNVSGSTLIGLRTRASAEGDGVLQMLLWLQRPPENFYPGVSAAQQLTPPSSGQILRFDAAGMYDALDTERLKRGVTWTHLARQIELPGSSLTRLQSGGRVTIDLAARVAALLRRPMASFTYHAPR